jgi:hypothetical protein
LISLLSAAIVAAAIAWAARLLAATVARAGAERTDARKARELALLQIFAPAIVGASSDPRVIIAWQPLARAARSLFADEFASLDTAFSGSFPLSTAQIEAAHAQWTAEWLAWERAHDAAYKLKAAELEQNAGQSPSLQRARVESIEREKLELYQRRYEEYVRVAKALQALAAKQ